MRDRNHVFHHHHHRQPALVMAEESDHKVLVEDTDWMRVEHYYDGYVAENHMMIDWAPMLAEVDDHMDEEVGEVYDQHLNKINQYFYRIQPDVYHAAEVEAGVVMIDLEVVVQVGFVVVDNENVDYNYYSHDDDFDTEMMMNVEMMTNETKMKNYEMELVDDLMMKMLELVL
jgi:hypothetical protein